LGRVLLALSGFWGAFLAVLGAIIGLAGGAWASHVQSKTARADRLFNARLDAYNGMARELQRIRASARQTLPWLEVDGITAPDPPSPEEWREIRGRFVVAASLEALAAFDRVQQSFGGFDMQIATVRSLEAQRGQPDLEGRRALESLPSGSCATRSRRSK